MIASVKPFLKAAMSYPGNKGFQHAVRNIVNLIPPHQLYVEPFAGSAGIARNICGGHGMILNDIDPHVYLDLMRYFPDATIGKDIALESIVWMEVFIGNFQTILYNLDAFHLLEMIQGLDIPSSMAKQVFIYLDPPYPIHSRRSRKAIYNYEMSNADHVKLLRTVLQCSYNCMISTYPNDLYAYMLKDWNMHQFKTSVHGSSGKELIYFNYDPPQELHDYQFLGKDSWDRQRINRKVQRTLRKFSELPALERNKLIHSINNEFKNK